jgi:hypothetical protein
MAETNLLLGESLPLPDSSLTDTEADIEEPIYLILNASSTIKIVPQPEYEAARSARTFTAKRLSFCS